MLHLALLAFLLVSLAAARLNANDVPFIENAGKLDLTLSLLPSSSRNAALRLGSNIDIPQIVRIPFLNKAIGYVSLTRLNVLAPREPDPGPGSGYQCELQLRTPRPVSPRFLYFLFTGNTLNFSPSIPVSGDIGGGLRYALGSRTYLALTAKCSLYYPDGVVATLEPGIVWRGVSLACRTAKTFPPGSRMPAAGTTLAIGYRLSL